MCFSANASFGAGIVLAAAGVLTLKKTHHPNQWPFASIPLLFAAQQMMEGLVWLSFRYPSQASRQDVYMHLFLLFAHVVWPVWIPLSMTMQEKKGWRKKVLYCILGLALLLSAGELYCMHTYPVEAFVTGHHIDYVVHFPKTFISITNVVYAIVTLFPCFVSGTKKMWLFGCTLFASLIAAALFYETHLISVWCFFAALMSMVVYLVIPAEK
ncbi:MAG: hypothetical protein NVSMB63_08820 [Sediminibacterium sp.]